MYRLETDELAEEQVNALPPWALSAYAELRTLLEVDPWSGDPLNDAKPDGPVRTLVFGKQGEGLVTYLILDDQRRVDILDVTWLG